ncbi:uncharacterized protein LOC142565970 [Dermacentor variabilis]|uniref:uncharacterized protein LOC142565970 n=1 Tax=Dermacentor variabilis TaxID=34621 RepID=UPI003F5C63EF
MATSTSATMPTCIKELHPLTPLRGLGDCTTAQPPNPLTFAMQTTILAFASLLLPSLAGLSTGASSVCALPYTGDDPGSCHPPPRECSSLLDVPPEELHTPEITVPWMATSTSATMPTCIKELHPLTPLRGLGDCTTAQPPNPLAFAMQTTILAFASLLLPSLAGLSTGASSVCALPYTGDDPGSCHPPPGECSSLLDVPPEELHTPEITVPWMATSTSATMPTCIKELHPLTPLRGLCDCTTAQPPNPLTFAMQRPALHLMAHQDCSTCRATCLSVL